MALELNQITAITEKYFYPKLVDGVYNSNPFIARLSRPEYKKLIEGGTEIVLPVINSEPSVGGFYDDFDTLDTTPTDNITASKHQWKQLYEPVRVSRKQVLMNSSDQAKLDLVKAKMQVAEKNMRDRMGTGLFSDGTAATGLLTTKQITGLRAVVSTSSTYGGIAPADFAEWVGVVKTNSSVLRPLSLNLMQNTFGALKQDSDEPSVLVTTQAVYDVVWSLFQPHQRLMSEEMAGLGFKDILTFNGKPILVDSHCKANTIYFLSEQYLQLCVHRDEDFRKETLERLETSNSMLMRIFWMGNLASNNRRFQGELNDIEIAA